MMRILIIQAEYLVSILHSFKAFMIHFVSIQCINIISQYAICQDWRIFWKTRNKVV